MIQDELNVSNKYPQLERNILPIEEVFLEANIYDNKHTLESPFTISRDITNQTSLKRIIKVTEEEQEENKNKTSKLKSYKSLKGEKNDSYNNYNSNIGLKQKTHNGNILNILNGKKININSNLVRKFFLNARENPSQINKKLKKKGHLTFKKNFIDVVEIESYKTLNANLCFSDLDFVENTPSKRKSFCNKFCNIL